MSDQISVKALREACVKYADVHIVPPPYAAVTPANVLALLDVVEAARDYFGQSLPYSNDAYADLAQENLRSALARFDFGSEASR